MTLPNHHDQPELRCCDNCKHFSPDDTFGDSCMAVKIETKWGTRYHHTIPTAVCDLFQTSDTVAPIQEAK